MNSDIHRSRLLNSKYDEMGGDVMRLLFTNFLRKITMRVFMINEASLAILDDIDELADMIVASDIYASFEQAKQALENNDEAHLLYQSF